MDNLFSHALEATEPARDRDTAPAQYPVFSDAERTDAPSHKPTS